MFGICSFVASQAKEIFESRVVKFPNFSSGDLISVKYKILEDGGTRTQVFSGVVISKRKSISNFSSSFILRKISSGVGVEKSFMFYSPIIVEIEVLKRGSARKAKLYYTRHLSGKAYAA